MRELQQLLLLTGHNVTPTKGGKVNIDGLNGPVTRDAIRKFIAEHGSALNLTERATPAQIIAAAKKLITDKKVDPQKTLAEMTARYNGNSAALERIKSAETAFRSLVPGSPAPRSATRSVLGAERATPHTEHGAPETGRETAAPAPPTYTSETLVTALDNFAQNTDATREDTLARDVVAQLNALAQARDITPEQISTTLAEQIPAAKLAKLKEIAARDVRTPVKKSVADALAAAHTSAAAREAGSEPADTRAPEVTVATLGQALDNLIEAKDAAQESAAAQSVVTQLQTLVQAGAMQPEKLSTVFAALPAAKLAKLKETAERDVATPAKKSVAEALAAAHTAATAREAAAGASRPRADAEPTPREPLPETHRHGTYARTVASAELSARRAMLGGHDERPNFDLAKTKWEEAAAASRTAYALAVHELKHRPPVGEAATKALQDKITEYEQRYTNAQIQLAQLATRAGVVRDNPTVPPRALEDAIANPDRIPNEAARAQVQAIATRLAQQETAARQGATTQLTQLRSQLASATSFDQAIHMAGGRAPTARSAATLPEATRPPEFTVATLTAAVRTFSSASGAPEQPAAQSVLQQLQGLRQANTPEAQLRTTLATLPAAKLATLQKLATDTRHADAPLITQLHTVAVEREKPVAAPAPTTRTQYAGPVVVLGDSIGKGTVDSETAAARQERRAVRMTGGNTTVVARSILVPHSVNPAHPPAFANAIPAIPRGATVAIVDGHNLYGKNMSDQLVAEQIKIRINELRTGGRDVVLVQPLPPLASSEQYGAGRGYVIHLNSVFERVAKEMNVPYVRTGHITGRAADGLHLSPEASLELANSITREIAAARARSATPVARATTTERSSNGGEVDHGAVADFFRRLPGVAAAAPIDRGTATPRVDERRSPAAPQHRTAPTRQSPPTHFFFYSGQQAYTRGDIDKIMATHGPNILIGNHHIEQDQSVLAYARSKGAMIYWYMLGGGEPATGYNNDGKINYPSDQTQIRQHIAEMNQLLARYKQNPGAFSQDQQEIFSQMSGRPMTRTDWDSGGWLLWHKIKLLEARDEERKAVAEGRDPRIVLPDVVEFDSLNNGPVEVVADQIADFSRWRQEKGIKTRLAPKNLEHQHLAPIDARVAAGSIDMDVFAPIHILEEYASQAHVRIITEWARKHGHTVVQTIDTNNYKSPNDGFRLPPNLNWGAPPAVSFAPTEHGLTAPASLSAPLELDTNPFAHLVHADLPMYRGLVHRADYRPTLMARGTRGHTELGAVLPSGQPGFTFAHLDQSALFHLDARTASTTTATTEPARDSTTPIKLADDGKTLNQNDIAAQNAVDARDDDDKKDKQQTVA